jgi:cytosine/adenosine deaminase-related metal-dependent hydrolase
MIRTIHRAKFVLTDGGLLRDAAVFVSEAGRVLRIEPWNNAHRVPDINVVDWGPSVILPGLVNAHTHLELTRLHGQVTGTSSFTQWLWEVVQRRRDWTREEYLDSTRTGARMALASGTTLVGDVSASGHSRKAMASERLRGVVFEETLGLTPAAAAPALEALETRIDSIEPGGLLVTGASPHAPYSVSPDLYRGIAGLARRRSLRTTTHLAETRGEIEFLKSGTGEFVDFLSKLGVLPAGWAPPGADPVEYMESLTFLEQSPLLIHCNYVDKDSIARILRRRCSVVFCPRSNHFFGHEKHPVRQLLDAGINVALGTDSLASNHSLSMLDEIRFLFKTRKDLGSEEIFRMATLNGATALRLDGELGRLRPGVWADMAVVELRENTEAKHLLSQMLEGLGECVATFVGGEIAWSRIPEVGA